MKAIVHFRSWLEDYVRREFPRCDGIPDHLKAAHSTGNPDCLPLFGGVRAAWAEIDPNWDPASAIHLDELVYKSTVQGQPADYDAAFTRSANEYAASQSREVKRGPRGGRYTVDKTSNGRTYRRYF